VKLYTKHGDDGSTGLIGNVRVRKDDPRVVAYGDVDETNAAIGVALSSSEKATSEILRTIQADLFVLGAELATPSDQTPSMTIHGEGIARLERWIDEFCETVEPLRNFILPGGSPLAAALHLARTVCRRAERSVVFLAAREPVRREAIVYLNRLSDLLFALARAANRQNGISDLLWHASSTSQRAS